MTTLLADGAAIETPEGKIEFRPMPDTEESLRRKPDSPVLWLTAEQSNSSLIVDDAVMLKIFRKVAAGHHPEAEMGLALAERGFRNTPPLLGQIVQVDADGTPTVLGVVLFMIGKNRLQPSELTPDRTLNSLSRDSRMVKETLS